MRGVRVVVELDVDGVKDMQQALFTVQSLFMRALDEGRETQRNSVAGPLPHVAAYEVVSVERTR